jgi:hypothetical protein
VTAGPRRRGASGRFAPRPRRTRAPFSDDRFEARHRSPHSGPLIVSA